MRKNLVLVLFYCLLNVLTFKTSISFAENIHFGAISFESIKTDNTLEQKEKINILTEDTPQQKTLESLHPDLKKENDRSRELQSYPSANNYQNNSLYPEYKKIEIPEQKDQNQKIGLLKNSEVEPKVVYYLELRPIHGNPPKDIYLNANTYRAPVARLQPGELVKVVDSTTEYLQKLRLDRDNQGLWRQVARQNSGDSTDLHVYYDWKNFETIPSSKSAIDLEILVPRTLSSVPVFSRPGPWTWKDCQLGSDVCIDRIDQHVSAMLLDTTFTIINDLRTRKDSLQLYYKIGYKLTDKSGQLQTKIGWIPSYYANRKITSVPRNILSINGNDTSFETDEERASRLSKYYVFDKNMKSENKIVSRWMKKRPGEDTEVFDNTFSYDVLMAYSNFNLEQSFLDDPFKQSAAMFGLGVYAPIYVDLELQGTLMFSMPVAHEPANVFSDTPLVRGDQWLMYTTPVGLEKMPIKVGLGMYYLTMFESDIDFGFKSFVGFQLKVGIETERFWIDTRFGPTGQDFDFNMDNRELGASIGVRVNPSKGFDSLTLFLDYSQTTYKSPLSNHTTEFSIFNLGIRKTIR